MQTPILALMIPIIAIIMGIGIGMWGMYLSYRKRKEIFTLYHQERMAALDKGVDLPPLPEAFFTEDGSARSVPNPHRHLFRGLMWVLVGIALTIALFAVDGLDTALFALIPVALGLAHLIYYFTVGKRLAQAMEAAELAKLAETAKAPNG